MAPKLAIVIPAYKNDFLRNAILSITSQTCQDFVLYIGDDCSPNDLYSIVSEFEAQPNIVYHKFDTNLGGSDLVAQWNRCLDLVGDENWCWLFSDDDVMDSGCVEQFYNAVDKYKDSKLFHFDIKIINEADEEIRQPAAFPAQLSIPSFHLKKWRSQISSYVVEYIFEKEYFLSMGGFQQFKFAWHTDEATWTKLGHPNGLITIKGAYVRWRRSSVNITPNNRDKQIVSGKLDADIMFSKWVVQFYINNRLEIGLTKKLLLAKRFVIHLVYSRKVLIDGEALAYLKDELSALKINYLMPFFYVYYSYRVYKLKGSNIITNE